MSNQDIDGQMPPDAASDGAAPAAGPETLEQQLAKEREARALMRDRLRHTEALAAESHALRARMAQELEKVTADRDRLRSANATANAAGAPATAASTGRPAEPLFTPTMVQPPASRAGDAPLKPPPASRKGPWTSLAMLGVVAAVVGAVAWYSNERSGDKAPQTAAAPATAESVATANDAAPSSAAPVVAAAPPPAASPVVASAQPPSGAVALPPLTPEQQLAAAPSAAGPAAPAAPAGMPDRLRKALDGEGIAAPVDVDAATGRVTVADPQADAALRERTDMLIRAVYAGASLPEPQIEHRWMSPMRGTRATPAAADAPPPASSLSPAAAYAARHAEADHRKKPADVSVADAEELRPVLPSGRITASCMSGLAGKSTARRAAMTACMKHSCTSSAANHNSEECRVYDKAYPFASSPG